MNECKHDCCNLIHYRFCDEVKEQFDIEVETSIRYFAYASKFDESSNPKHDLNGFRRTSTFIEITRFWIIKANICGWRTLFAIKQSPHGLPWKKTNILQLCMPEFWRIIWLQEWVTMNSANFAYVGRKKDHTFLYSRGWPRISQYKGVGKTIRIISNRVCKANNDLTWDCKLTTLQCRGFQWSRNS